MTTQVVTVTGASTYTDWITVNANRVQGYFGLDATLVSSTIAVLQIKNTFSTLAINLGKITSTGEVPIKGFQLNACFGAQLRAGVSTLATSNINNKIFLDFIGVN